MKRNRKAKILATLGPASSSSDIIESLFKAGCDVFRLNFSHGSVETHRQNLDNIRALEDKYDHASCILADLQGPKLRVGEFKNTEEALKKGQKFILDTNSALGDDSLAQNSAYNLATGLNRDIFQNGAVQFLMWKTIVDCSSRVNCFDFEGSMIPGVESMFRKFGGIQTPYFNVQRSKNKFISILNLIRSKN